MNQTQHQHMRGEAGLSRPGFLLCTALVAALSAGCSQPDPGLCVIAIGRSGSEKGPEMTRRGMAALETVVQALPPHTEIEVWRFDSEVRPLFSAQVADVESLAELEQGDLHPASTKPGSRLDLAFAELVKEVARRPEKSISAVFITDGENTGRALDAPITSLGRDKRLKALWMTGLDQRFQATLDDQLVPLHERAIQGGWSDFKQDAANFRRRVRHLSPE